jgi:hypothetical protein
MATPMTADQLLKALKAEGLKVVEYLEWRTHERDDETGKTFGPVNGVMMHHTASGDGQGIIDNVYHGDSGLVGPKCHALINKKGVVYLISKGRANHAGGGDPDVKAEVINESYGASPSDPQYHEGSAGAVDGNDCFYGAECVNRGDGVDPWPAVQIEAMVKFAAAICRFYGWSAKSVIGHLEWSNWKIDPKGVNMATFRDQVQAVLNGGAPGSSGSGTVPKPRPVYAPFPGNGFFRLGKRHPLITQMGKALVRAGYKGYKEGPGPEFTRADIKAYAWWQRKLKYTGQAADGYPGKASWDKLKVPQA